MKQQMQENSILPRVAPCLPLCAVFSPWVESNTTWQFGGEIEEVLRAGRVAIGKQIDITMSVNLWVENRAGEREVL